MEFDHVIFKLVLVEQSGALAGGPDHLPIPGKFMSNRCLRFPEKGGRRLVVKTDVDPPPPLVDPELFNVGLRGQEAGHARLRPGRVRPICLFVQVYILGKARPTRRA